MYQGYEMWIPLKLLNENYVIILQIHLQICRVTDSITFFFFFFSKRVIYYSVTLLIDTRQHFLYLMHLYSSEVEYLCTL